MQHVGAAGYRDHRIRQARSPRNDVELLCPPLTAHRVSRNVKVTKAPASQYHNSGAHLNLANGIFCNCRTRSEYCDSMWSELDVSILLSAYRCKQTIGKHSRDFLPSTTNQMRRDELTLDTS